MSTLPEMPSVRPAEPEELDHLARLWHDAWQDAHASIVPAGLQRFRTLESFRERLEVMLPGVRVTGPAGAPAGFHFVKDDELDQLFVAAAARGTRVAHALIADAEAGLVDRGVTMAWLACAVGNTRAARFYEKHGWHRAGTMVSELPTPEGTFPLEVWRYEKRLP